MSDDIVSKLNEAAAQLRQATQSLGTDYLSRQSVPGPGHLPVGSGARALDLLPPDQADGSVLTLDSQSPLGVKWGAGGGGGEVDSDADGNVFEGPGALIGTTASGSVAVGYHALNGTAGATTNNVAVGLASLTEADTHGAGYLVSIGWNAMRSANLDGGGENFTGPSVGGGVAIGAYANSDSALPAGEQAIDFVSIGIFAGAAGKSSIAIGGYAQALAEGAVAVGGHFFSDRCLAQPTFSTALGTAATVGVGASGGVAIGCDSTGNGAISGVADLIVLGTSLHTTRIPGIPAFVSGDKYLVVDSSGDIHRSALGPAS